VQVSSVLSDFVSGMGEFVDGVPKNARAPKCVQSMYFSRRVHFQVSS